ncbi:hypothetical protein [Sodalis sp. RH22]|uniref:hypothetical protein n=1 Tax=unclassified Sodalis (in: enterobacteria) TaxID=2636512 RepID=UPI0039B55EA0
MAKHLEQSCASVGTNSQVSNALDKPRRLNLSGYPVMLTHLQCCCCVWTLPETYADLGENNQMLLAPSLDDKA